MPVAVPSVVHRHRHRRRTRRVVVAALGGFVGALLLCHWLGDRIFGEFPDVPPVSDKLAVLAARREEVDTVFVGSSRVYTQLSPRLFDAELRAVGQPCCSFNLGVYAMYPPESFQMLDRALALGLPRLRRVVLELANVIPPFDPPSERDTRRMTAWHRPGAAGWMLAAIVLAYEWPGRKAGWFYDHSLAAARCFAHVGDAHDALFGVPPPAVGKGNAVLPAPPRRVVGAEGLGADGDGFAPMTKAQKETESVCRRFLANLPAYARAVDGLRAPLPASALDQREPVNRMLRWELPRRVAALRARGIATTLFLPPTARADDGLRAWARDGGGTIGDAPVFVFNDPDRFPELYRADVRVDGEHLDEEGAATFTRLLARQVLASERQ